MAARWSCASPRCPPPSARRSSSASSIRRRWCRTSPSSASIPDEKSVFESWIDQPHGLILVTGPTGSGKTTTLYSALKALAGPDVNVTTIEDPIEMVWDGFNQVQVQPKVGLDFASALRHILRQDPDVIMVGEIRDGETAENAIQAALTGHLVLSTLHTNDAIGAVARLKDLGVPPFLLAQSLIGVMAQRLLAARVPALRPAHHAHAGRARRRSGRPFRCLPGGVHISKGAGCVRCRGTGYWGRTGAFEIVNMNNELRDFISRGANHHQMLESARRAWHPHAARGRGAQARPGPHLLR